MSSHSAVLTQILNQLASLQLSQQVLQAKLDSLANPASPGLRPVGSNEPPSPTRASLSTLDGLSSSLPSVLVHGARPAKIQTLCNMPSVQEIDYYIRFFTTYVPDPESDDEENAASSPTTATISTFSSLCPGGNAPSSATSYVDDPRAVSCEEAKHYYDGVPSKPMLIYRTHNDQSPAGGPPAQRRQKRGLHTVFNDHPLADLWNDGLWADVVEVMDAHEVFFTTLDVVRFKAPSDDDDDYDDDEDEDDDAEVKKPAAGPVTVWVGAPGSTAPTTAHNAAQDVLALLGKHGITDVNVEFRESYYHSQVGPRLFAPVGDLHALADVVSPLTPALGLGINAVARPKAQGTMCLYLKEGGGSDRLLGLTCRHVLFTPKEPNDDYVFRPPSAPSRNVLVLGQKSHGDLVVSIKLKIGDLGIAARRWERQIAEFKETEEGSDPGDAERARDERVATEKLLGKATADMNQLIEFQLWVEREWSDKKNRVLGHVLRSPAIGLGVGEHRFTEDWAIFEVDRDKLGDGFQGNKIDLGTKISPSVFTRMCFPHPEADWAFDYPTNRLQPVRGIISNQRMRAPDMKDQDGEPCLLVVKHGNATGTTVGRANGVFSVIRRYKAGGVAVEGTSLEWGIINYDSKSGEFSKGGDSGSAIVDIKGRMGGKLCGGGGSTETSDMTYATPFWWDFERVKANGFPNAHLGVV